MTNYVLQIKMKNIEFTKKYGFFYNQSKLSYDFIKPYEYQNELLTKLEENRYISVIASRQMGITTMLLIHIANWLVNNKTNRKVIYFASFNYKLGYDFLDKLRVLLNYNKFNPIISNKSEIIMSNGNKIKLINNIRGLDIINKEKEEQLKRENKFDDETDLPYALIVDNAAFNKELELTYMFFSQFTNVQQIIMCSGFNYKINFHYDKIHLGDNIFIKLEYKWKLNPNFTNKWYDDMKNMMPFNYKSEIDLIRDEELDNNKSTVKSFRLEGDLLNKVSERLLKLDKIWSDYIRDLIEKDLSSS